MSFLEQYQLPFYVGEEKITAFLQGGFLHPGAITRDLHRHLYTEVHLIARGEAFFSIGEKEKHFIAGDVFTVPGGVFHHCTGQSENCRHLAFQLDRKISFQKKRLPEIVFALERAVQDKASYRVAAYLSALTAELFFSEKEEPLLPVQDRKFLINEFFSHCFQPDLGLKDLAEVLNVSAKQAQRLVKRYCGCTFSEKLTRSRLEAAEKLTASGVTLEETALFVGYRTPSALWKAKKRSREDK